MPKRVLLILFILCAMAFAGLLAYRKGLGVPILSRLRLLAGSPARTDGRKTPSPRNATFEQLLTERLTELEVSPGEIKTHFVLEDSTVELRARVPRGKPMEWVVWFVTEATVGTSYTLEDSYCKEAGNTCRLTYRSARAGFPLVKLELQQASRYFSRTARMAVLIEDFGFTADRATVDYLSFPEPLSVSLVPAKRLSSWTAQIANEYRKEVVIMLPMEPLPRSLRKYDNAVIKLHYPEEKIRSMIGDAVESMPNFAGFANLYGITTLEDSRVMGIVYSELRKRHGYFVGTQNSRRSVVATLSQKKGVPVAMVETSLDTSLGTAAIQDSLRAWALIAQRKGSALISSRPGAAFIQALRAELPNLKQNGIRLVYVSEIVHHPDDDR